MQRGDLVPGVSYSLIGVLEIEAGNGAQQADGSTVREASRQASSPAFRSERVEDSP